MNTVEITDKKIPLSEAKLLKNIDEYNAHADEIVKLMESEFCNEYNTPSTSFLEN